ncbi:MAG: FUSC family protein, partial [Arthrobacter sp.]
MKPVLRQVRALHRLEPANNDHLAALRVALGVAIPSLLLLALGRADLIIYAVFGALTGMYGRSEPHQLRLRHQGHAALVLLSGVAVGVLLSANHLQSWWLVAVEALLAGAGSVYSDRVNLKPNGP